MPVRTHLTSLTLFSALKSGLQEYKLQSLRSDIIAGITVGIIAIPLAMALAIAAGVPPQYGLYTSIFAGALIALTGGSRFSVSGPTAAFIVILYPLAQRYGLAGIATASVIAGIMQILFSVLRLGRLIEFIPLAVTYGFTSGIAVVIALLQLPDLLGLTIESMPASFFAKVAVIAQHLTQFNWAETTTGLLTLLSIIVWNRFVGKLPGHLIGLVVGVALSQLFLHQGISIETIGSRFSYIATDGSIGHGIPPMLPSLNLPWLLPGADGAPLNWDLATAREMISAAFSIAMLGAIESLLCAVVLDGMTRTRHQANGELLGQGLGNIIAPFFGGITATAAIARSAANVRAGAVSPIAAIIHAFVVFLGLILLTDLLALIPMSSMAALLLVVAANMSEAGKAIKLIKKSQASDIMVLLLCFTLTVTLDMVIAISTGIVLAAILFMKEVAAMTRLSNISQHSKYVPTPLPDGWEVYKINGSLFFAAADRIFSTLEYEAQNTRNIILFLDGVSVLDAGGISALEKFQQRFNSEKGIVIITDLQFQPLKTIAKAGILPIDKKLLFMSTLDEALQFAMSSEMSE